MIPPAERDARLVARYRRIVVALVALLVAAEVLAAAGVAPEPLQSVWGPHGFGQFFAMALLGTFTLHLWCGPSRREAQATIALAVALELARVLAQHALGWEPRAIALSTGFGAGVASLMVLAIVARHSLERRVILLAGIIVPFAVLLSNSLVQLTAALHPLTLDALVYAFDGSLGLQPSFLVGRLFARAPALARVAEVVYLATPFGFALLWAAQRRSRAPAAIDVMTAFLVATGAGFALYHAFPVAGPVYVVGNGWPMQPPSLADMGLLPGYAQPVARNCMPSLHTTWVLLLAWHSRGRGVAVRAIAFTFLTFTLLATLGEGLHYLTDLVVAMPFAQAAQAASAPASPSRRPIFVVAAVAVVAWLVLLRAGVLVRAPSLPLSWLLVLVTVAGSLLLERRLYVASVRAQEDARPAPLPARAPSPWSWLAAAGGAALALVVAPATANVSLPAALVAFALGAIAGETAAARHVARATGASAALLAIACASAPWLSFAVYVAALATGALLASLARRAPAATSMMAALVAGALATLAGDALLPALGVMRSDWLAAAIALGVTVAALRWGAGDEHAAVAGDGGDRSADGIDRAGEGGDRSADGIDRAGEGGDRSADGIDRAGEGGDRSADGIDRAGEGGDRSVDGHDGAGDGGDRSGEGGAAAVARLVLAGVASFAFIAAYRPLVAFVVGDNVYARADWRALVAGGVGLGVLAARAAYAAGARAATVRAVALALLSVALAVGGFGWRALAHYFASFAAYPMSRGFGAHEVARFCAAAVAVLPPAACAGAAFASVSDGRRAARAWALFAAAGAVATVSVAALLPWLGAWQTARLAAALAAVAALVAAARRPGGAGAFVATASGPRGTGALVAAASGPRGAGALVAAASGPRGAGALVAAASGTRRAAALASIVALLVVALGAAALQPRSIADAQLVAGSHVAFALSPCGDTLDSASDASAIATIARGSDGDGHGDGTIVCLDGRPLLEPVAPGAVLADAGTTALVVGAPPPPGFATVDALTPSTVATRLLARAHAGWHVRAGDARAALAAAPGHYDLVSLADASLLSRDLFAVAARALSPHGRAAVALPLARLSPRELAALLAGARAAFADVALQLPSDERAPATLLGCVQPCPRGAAFLDADALDRYRAAVAERGRLDPDELAAEADAEPLAWSLPRAAARPAAATWKRNLELLSAFAAH